MLTHQAPTQAYQDSPALTIRWSCSDDAERLEILSELDEAPIPAAPLLLAFMGEDLWAARSLSTGESIADPFRPSAEVTRLLAERGRQLTVLKRRSRLRRPRLGRHAAALRVRARLS